MRLVAATKTYTMKQLSGSNGPASARRWRVRMINGMWAVDLVVGHRLANKSDQGNSGGVEEGWAPCVTHKVMLDDDELVVLRLQNLLLGVTAVHTPSLGRPLLR